MDSLHNSHKDVMRRLIVLICAMIIIAPARRLSASEYIVNRLTEPITLDGMMNESAWDGIESLPMTMHLPVFGNQPTLQTDALLGYDDLYLYVGARCLDDEPEKIQAPTKKRDAFIAGTDWFGIIIDTFNDKENAVAFFTTPSGVRLDAAVLNDAVGELPVNIDWNTFWDVKTLWDEHGWSAEFRIPFSSLRFQDVDGRVTMGLIAWRWIPHKNEWLVFPAIAPHWGDWSTWKPSQAAEIVLTDATSPRPFYVAPYVLGGVGQEWSLDDDESVYVYEKKFERQVGGDIKYGLASNLTLDVTLNTDFAQVEADDQEVNLTRFSLFFPEKRLFFQERTSNFEFQFEDFNRLFYSRRIGLREEKLVPLYGGARLVGRTGPWDVGFLNLQTAPIDRVPSENFTVLRLRRRVINSYSYAGGIFTNRMGTDGTFNTAWGIDGIFRLFGDDYLTVRAAQTFAHTNENNPFSLHPARLFFNWERRRTAGLGYDLSYSRAGIDYDPGIGYEQRENFTRVGNRILYGWLPGEASPLYQHRIFVEGFTVLKNDNGQTESSEIGAGWLVQTKDFHYAKLACKSYVENVQEAFDISDDVKVPIGTFRFYGLEAEFQTPAQRYLYLTAQLQAGQFYDGSGLSATLWPIWNVINDFELSLLYTFNWIDFTDRQQRFVAHIVRLRALATLSLKCSILAFIQYNTAANVIMSNIRFRFNPREGTDLYIVYDEGMNTNREREWPVLPARSNRTILLKYAITFQL